MAKKKVAPSKKKANSKKKSTSKASASKKKASKASKADEPAETEDEKKKRLKKEKKAAKKAAKSGGGSAEAEDKAEGDSGTHDAFSKGYERPDTSRPKLNGQYLVDLIKVIDKTTDKGGKALVISVKVPEEDVSFDHYVNYNAANSTAVALAFDQLEQLAEILDIETDKDLLIDEIPDTQCYARITSKSGQNGYVNYNVNGFSLEEDSKKDFDD